MSVTAGLPYDDVEPLPVEQLDALLGKTKGQLFFKKGAGFLGSLLCDHKFVWDSKARTAWCNGFTIGWNPKFFTWLTSEERVTTLAHELWHTGYLHCDPYRVMGYCPDYWNKAADYVINNRLIQDGFIFGTKLMELRPCIDKQYDDMSTEQIYHMLSPPPFGKPMSQPDSGDDGGDDPWDGDGSAMGGDVRTDGVEEDSGGAPSNNGRDKLMGKLVKAMQSSRMSKEAGVIPGETELVIDEFLNPVLPWDALLRRYFTALSKDDYSWKRPSRRYEDNYLPSLDGDNGLEHLIYYLDISGSVSDQDILRFNSEVKHIHETFAPKRLTLITFDTELHDFYEFTDEMPFDKIVVHGRGGTSLEKVEAHIAEHQPTAAVVFSDLHCHPMQTDPRVPVLWIVLGNKQAEVPFGQMIHLDNES